ncbi:MAG TPA: MBL fold metallo-hydrolase [Methanospirillum sp.]|uniref:MBL fold metallo-hydrolase n=1 Tax=Methanospirillum sp. TaxID=45200 RepID=UPI002CAF5EA6|nr:MBL fold metallo-hydrolase [Methanospirillum sp.]HOJ95231.1 MBL fold metallo-hydrolase [Methanospirillum sp.]HPP77481.1 MBL fold metallo-hydrolase [Methanospirillum sp.]
MSYSIKPVDSVDITVLVDNYTDLLLAEDTKHISRPTPSHGMTLFAEHGLSLLIRVRSGEKVQTILMDAGATDTAFIHNSKILGVDLDEICEIIISHGHYDHMGALYSVLRQSSCRIPVHTHPAAFSLRRKRLPDGSYTNLPSCMQDTVTHNGGILSLSTDPSVLADHMVMITGEIERTTSFEQGSPVLEAMEGNSFVKDSFRDDQSLIIHLKEKGLIIISGCAHAGIINSVRYAQKITGIEAVHAIMGGFHLSGPYFKTIIPDTISALQEINPDYIIPMHCTGWEAQVCMARAMPDAFVLSTVGTTFHFVRP